MAVVTLLTDFGTDDIYVSSMKGVIAGIAPETRVIDLTHGVRPQAVEQGAFLLDVAVRPFPPATVHVAVVDPGVGSGRRALAARTARATYLGPDNGILSRVLRREPPLEIVSIEDRRWFLPDLSDTFHGRDVFAPAAAHLSLGVAASELGPRVDSWAVLPDRGSRTPDASGRIAVPVVHVDRFGNLILDLERGDVGAVVAVTFGRRRIERLVQSYDGCAAGEPVLLWGSSGHLEVSINCGSAARSLRVSPGARALVEVKP